MSKETKLPELTGNDHEDVARLWDFLFRYVSDVNAQIKLSRIGCKRETIKFSSGRGIVICEGALPVSAVAATRNGGGGSGTYAVRSAVCIEPGAVRIQLTESYSGIADISVFWSKEANGNV
ncbi:MAG: hypothetical protein IJ017_04630 [Oscillospiraceae bacterium]|nr:hypothetical protein [Oscillospiraceae bacterium]